MLKIIISGCNGHMGRTVAGIIAGEPQVTVVAGFDIFGGVPGDFPVYADPMDFTGEADAVIDFSNPAALDSLLAYCTARKLPAVLCTTGYSPEQLAEIDKAAWVIPVFRSGNMSLGINLLADLVRRACAVLGDGFDVEIAERHHKRKVDAPSGTALILADAAKSALPYDASYVYERQSRREPRGACEIGISAVRGGTIVGEHEVIFAGLDEIIEIKHTAYSRDVFAAGAVKAAKYVATVNAPGLYSMQDLLAAN